MNVYAAAFHIEQRDAGPYSRATHSALRAFIVHAENDTEARSKAIEYYKNQYPHWYLVDYTTELVALYGISTEGASWAMEGH